jgi:hypothetical protein
LAGLLLGNTSRAQTWASPVNLTAPYDVQTFETCALPYEPLSIEYGAFYFYAPVAVYRVSTRAIGRPPALHPWALTLQPYGWDASLWVCRLHQANTLTDCEDASDNWGINATEFATVPGTSGTRYIVVAGNVDNNGQLCGGFTLTAQRY